jgi:hypothetical protein
LAYTYTQLKNIQSSGSTLPNPIKDSTGKVIRRNGVITDYQDFRDDLGGITDYKFWNDKNKVDIRFYDNRVDKLNKVAPYNLRRSENPFRTDLQSYDANGNVVNKDNRQDLIKFGFECLANSDFENSTVLLFRAYLSSITDNNNASYNPFKYMGRGENFYVYQGFDRSISFTFKIAIGSQEESDSSYKKLNYLISQVYPSYNRNTNFMTSPLIRLTIGDYLYRVHGFLENVNVTIDQNTSWEIDEDQQLPHVLDVAITFKPILNQLPQRGDANDATNVPSIIRQTEVREKSNVTSDLTQTTQNANTDPQTSNVAPSVNVSSFISPLINNINQNTIPTQPSLGNFFTGGF